MKLPVIGNIENLCNQCVALCCRYFALQIDKPESHRDFEDLRWYLLHEDSQIFVEDGSWYLQVNRKCRALLPDNRCGIYDNRPTICRGYTTHKCDWHADAYAYDLMFTEPDQIQEYGKKYLKQKRQEAAAKRKKKGRKGATPAKRRVQGARATSTARRRATTARQKREPVETAAVTVRKTA